MNTKSKIVFGISVACLVFAITVLAIVAVWASQRQEITTGVSISYVAMEVQGNASARYKLGENGDWQNMTADGTPNGETLIKFEDDELPDATLKPTEKTIKLNSEDNFVVFEYTFTNSTSKPYVVDLFNLSSNSENKNILLYALASNDLVESDFETTINSQFGDWLVSSVPGNGVHYIYLLAKVDDILKNSSYDGSLNFVLDGIDYSDQLDFDSASGTINGINSNSATIRIPEEIDGQAVTAIAPEAFANRTNLTELTIPDSVQTIGQAALTGCSNLKYLQIPFVGGKKGMNVYIDGDTGNLIVDGNSLDMNSNATMFDFFTNPTYSIIKFGYIFSEADESVVNEIVSGGNPTKNVFDIPSGLTVAVNGGDVYVASFAYEAIESKINVLLSDNVTNVGELAFAYCIGLSSVTLPNKITELEGFNVIGNSLFAGCINLTSITIPEGVQYILDFAFESCSSLTSIKIPDSVMEIFSSAFSNCSNLTSVEFGKDSQLTSIGDYTFEYCESLTSIIIPSSVQTIGSNSFRDCSGLTSITIPSSVTRIGGYAFSGCSSLKNVIIDSDYIYVFLTGTDANVCGGLLAQISSGETIRVLTSVVNSTTNDYIDNTSWYSSKTIEGDYTVFTKK